MTDEPLLRVYRERLEAGVLVRDIPRQYSDGSFHIQEKHGEASNQSVYTVKVASEDELIERMLTDNYYLRMHAADGSSRGYTQIRLVSLNIPEVGHFQRSRGGRRPVPERGATLRTSLHIPDRYLAPYSPIDEDRRALAYSQVRQRQGQTDFRKQLLVRYGGRCMISSCGVFEVVEAAHIHPYRNEADNHPANGLLLRADLHTLFDADLLGIEPSTIIVRIHPSLRETEYWRFDGMGISVGAHQPSIVALNLKWKSYQKNLRESSPDL